MLRFLVNIIGLLVIGLIAALVLGFLRIADGPSLALGPRLAAQSAEQTDSALPVEAPNTSQVVPKPVKLFTVQESSRELVVTLPATIEAAEDAELSFDIGGRLVELNVSSSDEVTRGQVIARLDTENLQNSLSEAKAEFDRAEAEYQRALRLLAREAISVSEVDTRRTERMVAAASLSTAQKRLDDATLRAPFDGLIADVPVERFQTVGANQTVAIIQGVGVAATVNLPADLVLFTRQFEPRDPSVVLDALPDREYTAAFLDASARADETTQTYEARFFFEPDEDLFVLPGMAARVETSLRFSDTDGSVIPLGLNIPISAIVSDGSNLFVWVFDATANTISRRDIELYERVSEFASVKTGLLPGDSIVAAGGAQLGEGTLVSPWQAD